MKRTHRKYRALWPFLVLAFAVGIAALLAPRTPLLSGHTLKHLAAGGAGLWILRMLEKRRPVPPRAREET